MSSSTRGRHYSTKQMFAADSVGGVGRHRLVEVRNGEERDEAKLQGLSPLYGDESTDFAILGCLGALYLTGNDAQK